MPYGVLPGRFAIRFTPYDLSGWSFEYLKKYETYIVGREDKDRAGRSVPVHYHVYIETTYGEATVRQATKEALRLPAGGRGKNNKHYSLKEEWNDPGYMCKYNEILDSKGFTEKELMDFVISGKNKYLNKVETTPAANSVTAGQKSTTAKTPRIPYQQQIITIAYAEWMKYKRQCREEGTQEDRYEVIEIVCKAMREVSRGLNEYLLKDICNAVLFDDPDYREITLQRLKSKLIL